MLANVEMMYLPPLCTTTTPFSPPLHSCGAAAYARLLNMQLLMAQKLKH